MILFKTLRWKNLLSTGNYFSEIQLNANTNSLIIGENGSGKSTMLDALCFALFGKAFRNVNKPNLLNSINGKDCVVEVEFDIGNKQYKIVRGIKPNIFEIYQDGTLVNQDAAMRDYQEYLEKFIIKLNYKSFTQIVILGSASFVPFMQLSASDRRAIIEDLLDIQIFSTMNGLVRDKISINKDAMITKKNEIELMQQKYDIKKEHQDKLNEDKEVKVNEYASEIQSCTETLRTISGDIDSLEEQKAHLLPLVAKIPENEKKIIALKKVESKIESKISEVGTHRHFYDHNADCPTCRQTITVESKERHLGELQSKEQELASGLKELQEKITEHETLLGQLRSNEQTLHTLRIELATKQTGKAGLEAAIVKLQKQIDDLNSADKKSADVTELTNLKTQIKTSKEDLKVLIEEKSYYEVATSLLKDSGIKTKIIKQYLPIINKLVNKYLASLDFFVNFNLDESFKETIKSRHRDDFSYHNFSEGEKQRIDMALMLTWRAVAKLKNSSSTNLLILDEVFDSSLDTTGTEELMKILHGLEDVNLFVISHKGDILQDKFANTIRFKKVKNFSRIIK
jgi:DNA repair exonuclease SbcCD ATPase subunit